MGFRIPYVIFFLSAGVAIASLVHQYTITRQLGLPTSTEGIEIRRNNVGLNVCVIVTSVVGLCILCNEIGNKCLAITYTFSLLVCICLALVVTARTFTWQGFDDELHLFDMRNASVRYVAKHGRLPSHLISVQNEHKCCGIKNALEWHEKTALNIARRIPDACCVEEKRKCGEKALPIETVSGNCGEHCWDKLFGPNKTKYPNYAKLQVELQRFNEDPNIDGVDFNVTERDYIVGEIKKKSIDVCSPSNRGENIFFILNTTEEGGKARQTAVKYGAAVACFNLFHRNNVTNGTSYENFDEFMLATLRGNDDFYVDGCFDHLLPYVKEIIMTAAFYAIALGILVILEIVVFYRYYWEFRLVQLNKLPSPIWFEKLGTGDTAPVGVRRTDIRLADDPETISKNFHRSGLFVSDGDGELHPNESESVESVLPSRNTRFEPVRYPPRQNRVYPSMDAAVKTAESKPAIPDEGKQSFEKLPKGKSKPNVVEEKKSKPNVVEEKKSKPNVVEERKSKPNVVEKKKSGE